MNLFTHSVQVPKFYFFDEEGEGKKIRHWVGKSQYYTWLWENFGSPQNEDQHWSADFGLMKIKFKDEAKAKEFEQYLASSEDQVTQPYVDYEHKN